MLYTVVLVSLFISLMQYRVLSGGCTMCYLMYRTILIHDTDLSYHELGYTVHVHGHI